MKKNKVILTAHFIVFILCLALVFIMIFIEKNWGQVSLEQLIFNLNTPTKIGEDLKYELLRSARQLGTVYLFILALYCFLIFKIKNRFLNNCFSERRIYKYMHVCVYIFPLFILTYLNHEYKIITQIKNQQKNSTFIEKNYKIDKFAIKWEKKKNLVFIIAESLENIYADKHVFNPLLIPGLRKIQQENISFESQISTPGTEWSIAGITSYFFGIPLKLPIHGNTYIANKFLPSATSIIEIMEDAGYTTTFISGYDTEFAGYDKLIATHSRGQDINEKYFVKQGHSLEKLRGEWGFKDSFIFSQATDFFKKSLATNKPFALIIVTCDTHFPSGFAEEKFRKYNDIRDAYISLDYYLSRFVQDIITLDKDDNTTIIIVGDHLSMRNDVYDTHLVPNHKNRTIYNAFINPHKTPVHPQEGRILGSVDIAPSILEAIGCKLPEGKFGLGVSLFSKHPTLLEQDKEKYFEEIQKRSEFYNKFF